MQEVYLLGKSSSQFYRYHQLIEKCSEEGKFLTFERESEWLACYEKDAQSIYSRLPLLVFRPYTIHNIASFLKACYQFAIPVTLRCGGTSLVGSCVPSHEGVILLTGHLKKIENEDPAQGVFWVEPGVSIRQLNEHVAGEGWHFPLLMATEGVAGIAGCLSTHSRGYHQQEESILDVVEEVLLVDGQGEILKVPAPLVCGAEGLWGVILKMKIQLKKKSFGYQEFIYQGSWQELLDSFSFLHSIHALKFVTWHQNCFYLGLEGEAWRLDSASRSLLKRLPEAQPTTGALELLKHSFLPSYRNFVVISSVFHSHQLPKACSWSIEQGKNLQLECLQQVDLLAGTLHLILQSKEENYPFSQKVEQFLVLWVDFLEHEQGILGSCHGVGMQMSPYMPPFWKEETQSVWRRLQAVFDPKELLGRERFFPISGKSLEKMRQG